MKNRSSKSLIISIILHAILAVIASFWVIGPQIESADEIIHSEITHVKREKIKRRTDQKRTEVKTRKVSNFTQKTNLKILTSNAPPTDYGVISADQPAKFTAFENVDLSNTVGLNTNIAIPQAKFDVGKMIEGVPKTDDDEIEVREKSRLVKFIERQNGPQKIIYIFDLSSSMRSLKLLQIRKVIMTVQNSLTFLEPHDTFQIITFSGEVIDFPKNFASADDRNIANADNYLDQITPEKSKRSSDLDMIAALDSVIGKDPTIVVLFSDGILTSSSGVPDLKAMKSYGKHGFKIFAMAIGMSENFPGAVLLRTLSENSDGEFWLIERSQF